MKSIKYILTTCMAVGLLALSAAEIDGFYFWKNGTYTRFEIDEIIFGDDKISIGNATFSVDEIDSITFVQPAETIQVTDTVYVNYAGPTATVNPQNVEGITTSINGAAVTTAQFYRLKQSQASSDSTLS